MLPSTSAGSSQAALAATTACCSLQAEGVPELAAMEDLLSALLALRHAAEAARHEPAGKLRPTAVWVAAHTTGAWLACHPAVDSLPPLVWDEGGEFELRGGVLMWCHGLGLCSVLYDAGLLRRARWGAL